MILKKATVNPGKLAQMLIADLGQGFATHNGDRTSEYCAIATSIDSENSGNVWVSLIEEKANLAPCEWGYGLHIINDIDNKDCELRHTNSLVETELSGLLAEMMKDLSISWDHLQREG